ncbi:hypothetical protein [Heyndrickxia sporothermodurans]|uniref:hypothetical protein n=1 Tax=Heyndrickxia sporothermodurans TaxID=46224 RepID=UPI000D39855A|nr:hypothetical protein [Heyndrickxia sporothermodurans]PTY93024.1 hypothetical protein B5V90_02775 [Heyndrickxia sporothermodurans]
MEEQVEKIPVYRYWKPCYSTEHYLLLREITELWDLYSTRGKVKSRHTLLTTTILQLYSKRCGYEQVYYETRHGLKAVYPREVYEGAYKWFLEKTDYAQEGTIKLDGKNFAYTIGKPEPVRMEEPI